MALASRAPGAACRPRSCLCRHRAAAGAPTYGRQLWRMNRSLLRRSAVENSDEPY